jgi:hypothetical protein
VQMHGAGDVARADPRRASLPVFHAAPARARDRMPS